MKLNEKTSLEPRFYEAVQELVDDIHHSKDPVRTIYRARLDGMLTALHALTGEIWTIAVQRIAGMSIVYIRNEADDERVIPSHFDCGNMMTETAKPQRITTICISRCDPECTPWVSSFSSRERAVEFQRKVEEKLDSYGVSGAFLITMDSGDLNDEQYLDWLDAEFGKEETHDDE